MKKLIALLALFPILTSVHALGSDEILAKIRNSSSRSQKVEKAFQEVRTAPNKQNVTLKGKLTYVPENFLTMEYENKELFSIDGNIMIIDRDGKHQQFDISKNIMMKGLSHAILFAFSGKMDELAKEQNANLLTSEKDGCYVIAITAKTVAARGYSCIEATYDAKTGVLLSMRMDEFTGQRTYYSYTK